MVRILVALLIAAVALISLATILVFATASLANGVAFAAASTALLISQCISGLLVLAALAGGIGLGFGAANFLAFRRAVQHNHAPYPEAHPALSQMQSAAKYLPDSQTRLPAVYLSVESPTQVEETEDSLFENWGW